MEDFKIFGYTNLTGKVDYLPSQEPVSTEIKEIIITDTNNLSSFSTYDERFSLDENDKATLEFSIIEQHSNNKNLFIDLVKPQSIIGLEFTKRKSDSSYVHAKKGQYYKFKVLTRTPEFHQEGIIYRVVCEDYASQVYSRQGNGLTLDITGSLREIAEEILGETRKNNLFKELNRDLAEFSYRNKELAFAAGLSYDFPYINYKNTTMGEFITGRRISYASFVATDKFVNGEVYDLHFDLVGLNRAFQNTTENFQVVFQVHGVAADGTQIGVGELVKSEFSGNTKALRLPIKFIEGMKFLELKILKDVENPWPDQGIYTMSLTNFKITKNREKAESREASDALIISKLENFYTDFTTSNGSYYSEIKMTFSIQNSNLYNALVSLAALFDAEVRFDYQYNSFFFVSKVNRKVSGLRIDPEINLLSLSRVEESTEYASILHLQGSEDIEGAIPALPKEWRQYLTECYENKFSSEKWFRTYNSKDNYSSKIPLVSEYITEDDNLEERLNEITKFANHVDKIPNFESTVYDFSYFLRTKMLSGSDYNELIGNLYQTIRKLNISINMNTYRYYSIYSDHSTQLLELSFYINAINTERKFQYNAEQKLNADDAPEKYTASWISYMNQIDASKATEIKFMREIDLLLGLLEDGHLDMSPGSFAYNTLMVFGYESSTKNGVVKLLDKNKQERETKAEELRKIYEQIAEYEEQINDPDVTSFVKDSIAVDLAGARRRANDMSRFLGIKGSILLDGIYNIEAAIYTDMISRIDRYPEDIPELIRTQRASLYDLIINAESPENLIIKKENELEFLMTKFEAFSLEARYENSDEPTSYGLLEQGLKAFSTISSPQVNYGIDIIHIGAIEGYEYIAHPNIGDKVYLEEELFLDYDGIEKEPYLIVNGYSEDLREPGSLKLDVSQEDQSEKIIARMLETNNFVQIGETKFKSKFVAPIPNDLQKEIGQIEQNTKELQESGLSVSSLFNPIIK